MAQEASEEEWSSGWRRQAALHCHLSGLGVSLRAVCRGARGAVEADMDEGVPEHAQPGSFAEGVGGHGSSVARFPG